jgi:CheY-like chemotaxis protein
MRGENEGMVLVVDDDQGIREGLEMMLQLHGLAVSTAADGAEALDRLRSGRRPCLILLDLMMPGMNGFELRRILLEDPELAAIPVVVITGAGVLVDQQRSAELSAEVLRKPFEVQTLLENVRRYCKGATGGRN